jgi:DNA-binding transcriptional ArsR family regulator
MHGISNADSRPHRTVEEAVVLRAVAHPLRLSMLEYLAMRGSLTAAEAADAFAESPQNCEFHLRTLAEHGYVDAIGDSGGEPRWQLRHIGMSVSHVHADEELSLAADAVSRLLVDRWIDRIRNYVETRHCYSPEWRAATGWTGYIAYLTLEEAREFTRELSALLNKYRGRLNNPDTRPAGARPVEVIGFVFPIDPHQPGP